MHVLGSEEAYFRFPEKEERLQDLVHMFLPLISGFVHLFDAVCPGGFYIPGYLHNPSFPVQTLCIGRSRTWGFQGPTTFPAQLAPYYIYLGTYLR